MTRGCVLTNSSVTEFRPFPKPQLWIFWEKHGAGPATDEAPEQHEMSTVPADRGEPTRGREAMWERRCVHPGCGSAPPPRLRLPGPTLDLSCLDFFVCKTGVTAGPYRVRVKRDGRGDFVNCKAMEGFVGFWLGALRNTGGASALGKCANQEGR